jgi:hypothetical protein
VNAVTITQTDPPSSPEPKFDPTEERQRRIHLHERRKAEILAELTKIDENLDKLNSPDEPFDEDI